MASQKSLFFLAYGMYESATGNVICVEPTLILGEPTIIHLSNPESSKIKRIYSEKGRKSICGFKSEIQEIGRSLNATKGLPLMRGFLRLYIPESDWRDIDVMWDGIGDWQC